MTFILVSTLVTIAALVPAVAVVITTRTLEHKEAAFEDKLDEAITIANNEEF